MDKGLELSFYSIVLLFSLLIGLQIEGNKKPTVDTKQIVEKWPEFWGKKQVFISYNLVQEAVKTNYYIYHNFFKPRYIKSNLY